MENRVSSLRSWKNKEKPVSRHTPEKLQFQGWRTNPNPIRKKNSFICKKTKNCFPTDSSPVIIKCRRQMKQDWQHPEGAGTPVGWVHSLQYLHASQVLNHCSKSLSWTPGRLSRWTVPRDPLQVLQLQGLKLPTVNYRSSAGGFDSWLLHLLPVWPWPQFPHP